MIRPLLAGLIFAATLVLVVTRPKKLSEAISAGAGALLMIVTFTVPLPAAVQAIVAQWNVFLFFFGMMLIAAIADLAGFFDWAGTLAAALSRGSGRLLLLNVFLVGTLISTFLSNDATALILTPVVYAIVTRLGLPVLPYLFATTFIADTASMMLPISNPINILMIERVKPSLGGYESHLLLASFLVIAINVAVFAFVFRRSTERTFQFDWRSALKEAVPDPRFFRSAGVGLAVIVVLYLAASAERWPLGAVATAGGLGLALIARIHGRLALSRVRHHVSGSLFLFIAGLFILVRGVEDTGLTAALVGDLAGLVHGPVTAAMVGIAGTAIGANLINNVPMMLVVLSGLPGTHLSAGAQQPFVFGALVGADLGPNLTPVGSLSTMLWLLIVRRHGIDVSTLDYLRLGALVTPGMLLGAAVALALTFR
ncbi:MAG: SLC13 family permease [Candidatus Dormibacteraeota bacterium]|nr:SLC13 family permease [Candidatus Dormibacteraeota bacterium]